MIQYFNLRFGSNCDSELSVYTGISHKGIRKKCQTAPTETEAYARKIKPRCFRSGL